MKNLSLDSSEVPRVFRIVVTTKEGEEIANTTVMALDTDIPEIETKIREALPFPEGPRDELNIQIYPA